MSKSQVIVPWIMANETSKRYSAPKELVEEKTVEYGEENGDVIRVDDGIPLQIGHKIFKADGNTVVNGRRKIDKVLA